MTDLPALTHDTGSGVFRVTLDEDAVGLTVEGKPKLDEWVAYGNGIQRVGVVWGLVWGDFLNAFQDRFGEEWHQFVDGSDYEEGTSANYKRVCRVFPPDKRRIRSGSKVTISHLLRLSWNSVTVEEREMYLDQIENGGMTSRELYQLLSPKPEAIEFEAVVQEMMHTSDGGRLLYIGPAIRIPDGEKGERYKVKLTLITTSPPK